MRKQGPIRSMIVLVVLLCGMSTLAAAQEVAKVEVFDDTLVFHPVVEFAELHLTVTGPCNFEYKQRVVEGEPVFRLDETTIDGTYTYSLFVVPEIDRGVLEVLKRARAIGDNKEVDQLCRDGRMPGDPKIQSSGFAVRRGRILWQPGSVEKGQSNRVAELDGYSAVQGGGLSAVELTPRDQVINDDLIVDGSACIGFDCVNGESFGFDTIRLKENNLRIKFDDTSIAASFPRNDWQITANESANGGASKFSIDDITGNRTPFTIEANARSHSLYVDDGGRIGSRTSTPSVEIHTVDGDTPTLRLQQDGSSGFASQTWDVAGNETNFFVRDVTNGSTLPFRIFPDAPSNALVVESSGSVGIGTTSPDEEIEIQSSDSPAFRLTNSAAAGGSWDVFLNSNTKRLTFRENSTGNVPFKLASTANTNLLQVGIDLLNTEVADQVTIDGNLVLTGTCTTCDGVFAEDFERESIDEHAASMWHNGHLPAVGPTEDGETTINVFQKTTGMLQELEMAHIYIEQLHRTIRDQEARHHRTVQDLEARLEKLESGAER